MKACGVVAEYNPFHNGHLFQLKEARKRTGADIVVVAMSGNFLQRGEPAIVDKWSRASLALEYGADIVVELPAIFSVQPADIFAEGAVALLDALGCEVLSFGSESGTGEEFSTAGTLYIENEEEINHLYQKNQKQEYTYARNMEIILNEFFPEITLDFSQPNNLLGLSYAKSIRRLKSDMAIETVPRVSSHYHDTSIEENQEIASATAIRKRLFSEKKVDTYVSQTVPNSTEEILINNKLTSWDDFFPLLKYRVTVSSFDELSDIYLMETGLEYRIKDVMKESSTMTDYLTRLKSKQLSWTRLQRLNFYILLSQTEEQVSKRLENTEAIRLLGFTSQGQGYLSHIKHQLNQPLIANINQKTSGLFDYDITVGELYRLSDPALISEQDYKRKPIKIH